MADEYLDNLKTLVGRWKKGVADPDYQPSPEENAAGDNYYNNLNAAMVGSVAPEAKLNGILGAEIVAKNTMNSVADKAIAAATPEADSMLSNQSALLNPGQPQMQQVVATQQNASRAIDMANRYRDQLAAAKRTALNRLRK